MKYIYLC